MVMVKVQFRWQTLVDFIVLAAALYLVLRWAKQARAVRIAMLIIGLHAGALLARDYDLVITSWVLTGAGFLAIVVLLVVFQPELRHALMRVDAALRTGWRRGAALRSTYRAISEAAFSLAQARVGALIVLARRDTIAELTQGGVALGAQVSRELLEAIFQKVSPIHDGAAIVAADTITRANVVLPLTQRPDVPGFYGTRHRAAMGLSERSDALVVTVSEQRGTVTLMQDRTFDRIDSREELTQLLEKLHDPPQRSPLSRARALVTVNLRFKLTAVALAALIWGISLYTTGATVRTRTVPIEFTGVPGGMDIAAQSASEIEVQLRGNPFVMDSFAANRLVATFDLRTARPGATTLAISEHNFNLPPGIRLDRTTPRAISIRLVPRKR